MLGAPPPPPPPDGPALKEGGVEGQPKSVRERLELHRKNPTCASCHVRMDPLGFALENFDGVGRWRATYGETGKPVDALGVMPDGGARIDGPDGLRTALMQQQAAFVAAF